MLQAAPARCCAANYMIPYDLEEAQVVLVCMCVVVVLDLWRVCGCVAQWSQRTWLIRGFRHWTHTEENERTASTVNNCHVPWLQ